MTPNERIDHIKGDHWIAFDRAEIVLNRLTSCMEMPKQSRMPGLMVYGSSGIGKTMIAKRMASKYPASYDAGLGVTKTPILLVQAPPAPDTAFLPTCTGYDRRTDVGSPHGIGT